MMDNMLYIVPYTAEHGRFILSQQMNHKVLEADRHYINVDGDAKNLVQDHLAFTGIVNHNPIFAAGMKMIWGQVAEGWVIATSEMWKHPLGVAKAIKKDFKEGLRFAEWLGLEKEGLMRKWGFDGSDQYMYARLF